jgi:hypothetical protein
MSGAVSDWLTIPPLSDFALFTSGFSVLTALDCLAGTFTASTRVIEITRLIERWPRVPPGAKRASPAPKCHSHFKRGHQAAADVANSRRSSDFGPGFGEIWRLTDGSRH